MPEPGFCVGIPPGGGAPIPPAFGVAVGTAFVAVGVTPGIGVGGGVVAVGIGVGGTGVSVGVSVGVGRGVVGVGVGGTGVSVGVSVGRGVVGVGVGVSLVALILAYALCEVLKTLSMEIESSARQNAKATLLTIMLLCPIRRRKRRFPPCVVASGRVCLFTCVAPKGRRCPICAKKQQVAARMEFSMVCTATSP